MSTRDNVVFKERLWPSGWVILALTLIIPAMAVLMLPFLPHQAALIAVIVFLVVLALVLLTSPSIHVTPDSLIAGNANIPLAALGAATSLNSDQLKRVIGVDADARAFLFVRGYVHSGVKIAVSDVNDPTPYWVLTTRKPEALLAALKQ